MSGVNSIKWTIPCPSPETIITLQNTRADTTAFVLEAGLERNSPKHKELKKTVQILYRRLLHPSKHVAEQPAQVNCLVAEACKSLAWLANYEDGWPARVYLNRYIDGNRLHSPCTLHVSRAHSRRQLAIPKKLQDCHKVTSQGTVNRQDYIVREFLCSLTPNLEHHLDVFVRLGIKDKKTLQAFLSWPAISQAEFLDEICGEVELTRLEKKALLVGCGRLRQRALEGSIENLVKPGVFYLE